MESNQSAIKIFAGSYGKEFAQKMCDFLGAKLGESETLHFSDGNTFVKIKEMVRDKDVYLVQPIAVNPNDSFTEILFWLDAFKRASANSVTCVIPYFSYAKADKKDEPRVSIRARVCADSIELAGADRVIMLDLHSPQVQGFFKIPIDHLYAMPVLCEHAKLKGLVDDHTVVVSPDTGFSKNARKFADYLKVDFALGEKVRVDHSENPKCLNIYGNIKGKNCIIVDDFSISGNTLIEVAKALKELGANKIYVLISHLVLTKNAVQAIESSCITWMIGTDSLMNEHVKHSKKIEVVSIAPLFAEAVRRIHDRQSIGALFDELPTNANKYII